jgi:alpha-beta hydrolase superfamily lysophospholipase
MPNEQLQGYFRRLQNDSYMAFIDMLILNLPKTKRVTTPILVLGAENDTIFSTRQNESTARAYKTQAEMIPNIAHDMMLEANWKIVADRILTWLTDQGA